MKNTIHVFNIFFFSFPFFFWVDSAALIHECVFGNVCLRRFFFFFSKNIESSVYICMLFDLFPLSLPLSLSVCCPICLFEILIFLFIGWNFDYDSLEKKGKEREGKERKY